MAIRRKPLVIVGGALLLAIAAFGVLLATLDLNQFVGPVLTRIKNVTGREVTVVGGVGLQNSTVTALLNISVGDFSSLALSSSNKAITFIVTATTGS